MREELVAAVLIALVKDDVVIDATVHEADPTSIDEYDALFATVGVPWQLRVLHPRLDVAIGRDATRAEWTAGAARVETLWRKFSRQVFDPSAFLDTSDDEPSETAGKVLASLRRELPIRRGGVE